MLFINTVYLVKEITKKLFAPRVYNIHETYSKPTAYTYSMNFIILASLLNKLYGDMVILKSPFQKFI